MSTAVKLSAQWTLAFKNKKFITEFIGTIIFLGLLLFSFTRFLIFVQNREGVILPDPILGLFQPIDLTWFIFLLIYVSLIASVIYFLRSPAKLLTAVQLYSLMVLVRIISMYLVPLEPPSTMIPLKDPLVEFFGTGEILTKDLFFSGHTATLFLLFLISEKGIVKNILLICTILVALFVILQHIHYTIDVFAAVFFTYSCYIIIVRFKKYSYSF